MKYEELIRRLSILRLRNNFSARELSGRIGKSTNYIGKLECNHFQITIGSLFTILEACNISEEEFFSNDFDNYKTDKELIDNISSLDKPQKDAIIAMIKSFSKK